jgi:AcrR family transcriptional regulator
VNDEEAARPRPRGRPRDARVDGAVREAARSLLVEVGYANATMQEIAARANVGLPTIYRRWPSKAEVIEYAVFTSSRQRAVDADGDFFAELRAFVRGVIRVLCDPVTSAALPGLFQDLQGDPEVRTRFHAALVPSLEPFAELVAKAGADGVIAPDIRADEIRLLVVGAAMGSALSPDEVSPTTLEKTIFKLASRAIALQENP